MSDNVLATLTEQDELRQQIDDSRAALTEKLEMLEEKVADTVQMATASVTEATASVVETVHNATVSVSETVESVNAAVQGTVENVRHTVSDTVESVKGTFDLPQHVRKHPWAMLAGAVALGYVGGRYLLPTGVAKSPSGRPLGMNLQTAGPEAATYSVPESFASNKARSENGSVNHATSNGTTAHTSWFGQLADTFGPEIAKLEELAIGASLGLVRDLVSDAVPPALREQIVEVVDGFTEKLGGKCLPVPVVSPIGDDDAKSHEV